MGTVQAWLLAEGADPRIQRLDQRRGVDREDMVRRARGGPDHRMVEDLRVEPGLDLFEMPERRDAADREARRPPDARGIGLLQVRPHQPARPDGIDPAAAGGQEQDVAIVPGDSEHDRLDDLVDPTAAGPRRLGGAARAFG